MWPYATRGSRFLGDVSEISPSALESEDFSTNAASIKLWLPEKLVAAIDVLCDQHDASRPDVLRWILFEHVFGRVELAHLQRRMSARLKQLEKAEIMRSVRRSTTEEGPTPREINARHLGKATEDLKLFLPARLKLELQDLADAAKQAFSDYLRAVLARHLLGERFFRDWQAALAKAKANAEAEPSFRECSRLRQPGSLPAC